MTLHRTTRNRFATLGIAAALALAACDDAALPDASTSGPITTLSSGDPVDSSGGGAALGSAPGDDSSVIAESAPAEPEPTDEGQADAPASDDADVVVDEDVTKASAGGDCLVGSWVFTTAEMDAYYDQLEADGVSFDVTGDVRVELRADNTFTYTPSFGFTMNIDGLSAEGQSSGSAVGTYTAVDGHFTFVPTEDNIDFTVSMAGISMSASEMGIESLGLGAAGTSYSCEGGVPVFEYLTIDGTHPVALERA